jgi:hypothetical protein
MNDARVCPLLTMAQATIKTEIPGNQLGTKCVKEDCAWWIAYTQPRASDGACAILSIALDIPNTSY